MQMHRSKFLHRCVGICFDLKFDGQNEMRRVAFTECAATAMFQRFLQDGRFPPFRQRTIQIDLQHIAHATEGVSSKEAQVTSTP